MTRNSYYKNKLLSKVSHEIAGITIDWMTPVRSPMVKATTVETASDPEPYPESHLNADLSSFLRLIFLNLQLQPFLMSS